MNRIFNRKEIAELEHSKEQLMQTLRETRTLAEDVRRQAEELCKLEAKDG